MTAESPSTETIQLISRILAVRETPAGELPAVIAAIYRGLSTLGREPERVDGAAARLEAPPPVRKPRAQRKQTVAKRPLPQQELEDEVPQLEDPEQVAAPQPRLLRRADMHAPEHEHQVQLATPPKSTNGTVRGVVKWFDGRTGKGALRLTGVSGDVALDAAVLTRSGIKRLYKDQEVEATVQGQDGHVRLVDLTLPGRNASAISAGPTEDGAGAARRPLRRVTIEVKRDDRRQRLARAEAEQVLGGGARKAARPSAASRSRVGQPDGSERP